MNHIRLLAESIVNDLEDSKSSKSIAVLKLPKYKQVFISIKSLRNLTIYWSRSEPSQKLKMLCYIYENKKK